MMNSSLRRAIGIKPVGSYAPSSSIFSCILKTTQTIRLSSPLYLKVNTSSVRFFSSSDPKGPSSLYPAPDSHSSTSSPEKTLRQFVVKYWPYLFAAGSTLCMYGLSSLSMYVASSVLDLDLKDVFYAGFFTGSITLILCGLGSYRIYRILNLSGEEVFKKSFSKLARNSVVLEKLGSSIKPGELRTYQYARVNLSKSGYSSPNMQMTYHVSGSKSEGVVTVDASVNKSGNVDFQLIALDIIPKAGITAETILVVGEENLLSVRADLQNTARKERGAYLLSDIITPVLIADNAFDKIEKGGFKIF